MMGVWGSENQVFGEGRIGDIMLKQGGSLQTKREDEIGFAEHGMVVRHNDPADTITLIPWENIAMIRTALSKEGQASRKARQLEAAARRAAQPLIDVEALKRLSRQHSLSDE